MSGEGERVNGAGRPSNDRDGECICDYNPATTDGPQEDCPFHGRPYAYWVERVDTLSARLERVGRLAEVHEQMGNWARDLLDGGEYARGLMDAHYSASARLSAALTTPSHTPSPGGGRRGGRDGSEL